MESINIPSPSAILDLPPSSTASSSFPPSSSTVSTASRAPPARSQTTKPNTTPGNKPRQSKSRNGCSTCKAKRLKCDESRPSCLQCERRKVPCGGYKKDFKWRPFEETNVANKTAARGKNVIVPPSVSSRKAKAEVPPPPPASEQSASPAKSQSTSAGGKKSPSKPNERRLPQDTTPRAEEQVDQPNRDTLSEQTPKSWLEDFELPGPSPWISDVSPSSADLESTPFGMMLSSSPSKSDSFSFSALLAGDGEEIEDIVRQSEPGAEPWLLIPDMGMGLPSSADDDNAGHMATGHGGGGGGIPREPDLGLGSPEMLALRFNRVTCGILSIKDGMHENPWRRLVWPLAKDTSALCHALFSLAAFQSCKENPALRVQGVDHMRQSITCMVQDIRNMRTDAALATSLALAFADTWDQHTRSCIQHLRGAKALVSQVLELASRGTLYGADLERVRFLYNTWLYMDVISRLTSREGCEVPKMDTSIFHLPGGGQDEVVHEIDPLMGCATTLFPLINQVAGLIQRVRKSDSNSISLVSQAIELKRLVEQWEPPRWFEPPEDPTSEVQHSIQVAHAYRWATLLYLHQAVPEMPSEPTSELAKRVLILLATVPPSSRTTIIQMFPLMAAGCEAEQEEDRNWVLNRWMAVQSRLMLGGIDRCIEIVREVWNRQDAFQVDQERGGHKRSRSSTAYDGPGSWTKTPRRNSAVTGLDNIEHERTVRGRLHWVNVMDKWGWEVFL